MHAEKVLLDKYDVQQMLDVNEATMRRYIRDKVLPPRVVLSKRKMGWLKEDIMAMLHSRKEYAYAKKASKGRKAA